MLLYTLYIPTKVLILSETIIKEFIWSPTLCLNCLACPKVNSSHEQYCGILNRRIKSCSHIGRPAAIWSPEFIFHDVSEGQHLCYMARTRCHRFICSSRFLSLLVSLEGVKAKSQCHAIPVVLVGVGRTSHASTKRGRRTLMLLFVVSSQQHFYGSPEPPHKE